MALTRAWLRECWQSWATAFVLAGLVMFVVAPAVVPMVVPMSAYYELRSVTIANSTAGVAPKVIVDRVVHRDFRGRYEIAIMRADGSRFAMFWDCGEQASDWRPYRADAVIPSDIDLDWWLGIPPNRECHLPPGTYKVLTTIYARGPLGAELSATTESNVFTIGPPEP